MEYTYIKTDGSTGTTSDKTNAPGIDPHSGFQEKVSTSLPSSPVGILSSDAGKSVVNTQITPVVQQGQQAQAGALQTTQNNQTANDARAQTDAQNATPHDLQDPLQARLEANQKAQRDQLIADQQLYSQLTLANNEATASSIRQLQGAWADVQREQQGINKNAEANITTAGLRAGTARYAPQINEGMIAAQKSYGIQKLKEIDMKYNEAITSAQNGLASKNLEIAMASAKASQAYLEQANKEINDQITNAQKIASDAAKAKVDMQKEIDKVIVDAAKNGSLPPDVMASARSAGSVGEAVQALGDHLQTGTGTVGEYLYYKRDAMAHGQVPLSYNEYANMDANRKRSIVNVGGGGNLSNATIGKVQQVAGQFDGEQTVKDYNTVATQVNYVQSLGKNPTDDIARVYAFAKVMDPNSAVREGEYKTVADYSQALLQRQGLKAQRVFDNKGFLTTEARNFIDTTLNKRLSTQKQTYDNVANEYGRRIDKITKANDGKEWITDYSGGFSNTGNNIIQSENQAQDTVVNYVASHPELETKVNSLAGVVQPSLGRAYTWQEIGQIIGAQ